MVKRWPELIAAPRQGAQAAGKMQKSEDERWSVTRPRSGIDPAISEGDAACVQRTIAQIEPIRDNSWSCRGGD